jgi:glycosyltransferase involved in cell wall biosynthesis
MRILICNTFLYRRAGAETYTLALADLLRAHGHEVLLFGMNHPDNLPSTEQRFFADYIDFPTLHREKTLAAAWRVLQRSIYYPQAGVRVQALVEELKPDVAHLQNIHAHLTPSVITGLRRAGVPIVWTLHDFKLLCPEHSLYSNGAICEKCKGGRFYNCTVNRCKKSSVAASAVATAEAYVHSAFGLCRGVDRLIAPSLFMQRKFAEFGWTGPRLEFVRNFLPDIGVAHPGGGGYGVYSGMLRPIKGPATLLRGLAAAGDPPFRIAGDGPMRAELEALAQSLGLRNTQFLGHLSGSAVRDLVADASYAVVPSECYENCPYAILEAMAAGKAVIATNHGGMAELVAHDETGLLFAPQNATELGAMIRKIADDPALRAALGAQGRKVAEREFTPAAHYLAIKRLYDDVLAAREPAAPQRAAASSS